MFDFEEKNKGKMVLRNNKNGLLKNEIKDNFKKAKILKLLKIKEKSY